MGGSFGTMADLTPGLKEAECLQGLREALCLSSSGEGLFALLGRFIWPLKLFYLSRSRVKSTKQCSSVFGALSVCGSFTIYILCLKSPLPFYKAGYYSHRYNLEDLKIMHFK